MSIATFPICSHSLIILVRCQLETLRNRTSNFSFIIFFGDTALEHLTDFTKNVLKLEFGIFSLQPAVEFPISMERDSLEPVTQVQDCTATLPNTNFCPFPFSLREPRPLPTETALERAPLAWTTTASQVKLNFLPCLLPPELSPGMFSPKQSEYFLQLAKAKDLADLCKIIHELPIVLVNGL